MLPALTQQKVMSHHQRSSQQVRHTLKMPRDQSPPAPPATLKARIQPIVFNIVFYPRPTFSLFPTGKSWMCDTSTTGQSPVSSQPNQNKQLSTRFLNTSPSWLKFHKLFHSHRIGTSASSPKSNRNQHQLHQEHHARHHRALCPNKIMLPRY